MGAMANAAVAEGGQVIGVIPKQLGRREIANTALTELHFVETMHERKALMTQLSEGFLAMPGGFGTLDELFESLTWTQLGIHEHPIGLLNVSGFFNPLMAFLDAAVAEQFLRPQHRAMLVMKETPEELLSAMRAYKRPTVNKWMGPGSE